MFKMKPIALLLVVSPFLPAAFADDMTAALQQTQACLRNQNCESAKTGPGKEIDRIALAAVGGNAVYKQALYDISADIMPILVQQTGGDPDKMLAMLTKAQTDPGSFLQILPLAIQARIKNIAEATEKNTSSDLKP